MEQNGLPFEKPILELEKQIQELQEFQASRGVDLSHSVRQLRLQQEQAAREVYSKLSAWEIVSVARRLDRPTSADYIKAMTTDFVELHGDRAFRDDRAILCGFATLDGRKVMIVGHQKGKTTRERVACNWGSAHPEGYRKALHKMKLAAKFHVPIITLVDTAGAYPGIGSEERGVAQAIAQNLLDMSLLPVPIVSAIIGEGGSGGAIGIGVADRLGMLEFSYYSVISPEGCAAILWKSGDRAAQAAEELHLTAKDLHQLGVLDEVITEPPCAAHRRPREAADAVKEFLIRTLRELDDIPTHLLLEQRFRKFRKIGQFTEGGEA